MASTIHSNARTTPQIRRELQEAPPGVSDPELARRYGITRMTVRKWRYRREVEDRSHCPKRLHTTLTPEQEAIVVQVREVALLSLDDLLIVAREFLNPDLSRAALARCLRRHGVGDLRALQRERDGEPEEPAHKPFKDYVPGFVHVDVKYLPQMADQTSRGYLFVAIDRASRWVYLEVRRTKSADAARGFLKKLLEKAPFHITHLVNDNGKEFTDRFAATGERAPTNSAGHPPCCVVVLGRSGAGGGFACEQAPTVRRARSVGCNRRRKVPRPFSATAWPAEGDPDTGLCRRATIRAPCPCHVIPAGEKRSAGITAGRPSLSCSTTEMPGLGSRMSRARKEKGPPRIPFLDDPFGASLPRGTS